MPETEEVVGNNGGIDKPLTTGLVHDPWDARQSAWEQDASKRFHERMLDESAPFPCIFGVDALRKSSLRFSYVPQGPERPNRLAEILRDFVGMARELGRRTSLVAFFENEADSASTPQTVEEYEQAVWDLLQSVHELDDQPWPADIPLDTEDSEWEFSFAGMPMFVVANTPVHRRRVSRYFEYLTITFQPRFVFDDISENTKQGRNARAIIRERLADYDDVPASPLLGSFGKPGNREWTQYFLDDDNAPVDRESRCPMHVKNAQEAHR